MAIGGMSSFFSQPHPAVHGVFGEWIFVPGQSEFFDGSVDLHGMLVDLGGARILG